MGSLCRLLGSHGQNLADVADNLQPAMAIMERTSSELARMARPRWWVAVRLTGSACNSVYRLLASQGPISYKQTCICTCVMMSMSLEAPRLMRKLPLGQRYKNMGEAGIVSKAYDDIERGSWKL